MMDIVIESLLDGARRARGTAVVIDVFRAFSTAAVAFSRGAEKIIMVKSTEEALALRATGVGHLCVGEVEGIRPAGFDHGNSPHEMTTADVAGKTLLQRTSAGTQGIVAALPHVERLYAGSLVTAVATARAIRRAAPELVTLVAMGDRGVERTDEDEMCALHLRNLLEGRPGNAVAVRDMILAGERIADFRDPSMPHLPSEDLDIAIDVGRFDFAVRVTEEDGRPVARRETVAQ
jgi:2-phosphosulfolactate phosphatase